MENNVVFRPTRNWLNQGGLPEVISVQFCNFQFMKVLIFSWEEFTTYLVTSLLYTTITILCSVNLVIAVHWLNRFGLFGTSGGFLACGCKVLA